MNKELVLMNERFVPREAAVIDIEDRGYQFGDGVYEVGPVYEGKLFKLAEHLTRLHRSLGELAITLPYGISRLKDHIIQLCAANRLDNGIVYIQVTRGVAPRAHPFPPTTVSPQIIVYTKRTSRPVALQTEGVHCILAEDIRWLRCDIKSLNLLGNVMAKQKAIENQAFEAILHRNEVVTEGSSTNVFLVKNNVLYTHPANPFILNGITRLVVIEQCQKLNLQVREVTFSTEQLLAADEVFITSSTIEVVSVVTVDGYTIGVGKPGPVTRVIQEQFSGLISGLKRYGEHSVKL